MKRKKVIIVSQYLISDPPTINSIKYLSNYFDVIYIQQNLRFCLNTSNVQYISLKGINSRNFICRFLNVIYFFFQLNYFVLKTKPDIIIGIMFYPVSLIFRGKFYLITAVLDIPSPKLLGFFAKLMLKHGLNKLRQSDLTWASDMLRSNLIMSTCNLKERPIICHNTPPLNYFDGIIASRDWLKERLSFSGCAINDRTCVILRAGAIGENCGLEETILAMLNLPDYFVFILMGRPTTTYKNKLLSFISHYQMSGRVILWEKVDDNVWKKALLASDIGHLIHIRPIHDETSAIAYDLNSSLSNNRLFQYMAAGLPIISYNDPRLDLIHQEVKCFSVVDTSDLLFSIKKTLSKLGNSAFLRKEMGSNAIFAFKEKYNWEKQFSTIYQKIK